MERSNDLKMKQVSVERVADRNISPKSMMSLSKVVSQKGDGDTL
jgi:hypothetical protein